MNAVVFGGGKISRGFIAQLLYRSGFHIIFVELDKNLVKSLNESGRYYVNVMGNPAESQWIDNYECICLEDIDGIASALQEADIAFTSVGGKNLNALAGTIALAFSKMYKNLNRRMLTIITCENWKEPASQLAEAILHKLKTRELQEAFTDKIGISEAVVMRSGVEAAENIQSIDVNAVSVTDYWELPIDKSRIKGELIPFLGAEYKENFKGFLQQKLFTFNTTNATIAYLGCLRGMEFLWEAANDSEIVEIVHRVHQEINPAISREMGIPLEEQIRFSQKALKKYQDRSVTDFTERHARDPIRKLGPDDRIIGTLRLVEKQGLPYEGLALTAAAAIYYPVTNPKDPTALKLKELREKQGIDGVLKQICEISPEEKAGKLIKKQAEFLRQKGWLDV